MVNTSSLEWAPIDQYNVCWLGPRPPQGGQCLLLQGSSISHQIISGQEDWRLIPLMWVFVLLFPDILATGLPSFISLLLLAPSPAEQRSFIQFFWLDWHVGIRELPIRWIQWLMFSHCENQNLKGKKSSYRTLSSLQKQPHDFLCLEFVIWVQGTVIIGVT